MEVKYRNSKIDILTIPAGTLLFRAVKDPRTDFIGAKTDKGYCIPPHHNVWFYFSPVVIDGDPHWFSEYTHVEVYATTKDLNIVSLIHPSRYTRATRFQKKKTFMVDCNKTLRSCIRGNAYDPCFRQSFLQKYPDINGWIGIGNRDAKVLRTAISDGVFGENIQYIHLAQDARGVKGAPELALYPLQKRRLDEVVVGDSETAVASWMSDQSFNYKHILSLPRTKKDIDDFMKAHAEFVEGKWFYKHK
jgi:hypothetical protein